MHWPIVSARKVTARIFCLEYSQLEDLLCYYVLLDFLCNFRIALFIHFSGLLNPGKSLPPAIRSAKDMNTEKKDLIIYLISISSIVLKDYPIPEQ